MSRLSERVRSTPGVTVTAGDGRHAPIVIRCRHAESPGTPLEGTGDGIRGGGHTDRSPDAVSCMTAGSVTGQSGGRRTVTAG